jgi:hypothetical protein
MPPYYMILRAYWIIILLMAACNTIYIIFTVIYKTLSQFKCNYTAVIIKK